MALLLSGAVKVQVPLLAPVETLRDGEDVFLSAAGGWGTGYFPH